MYAFKYKKVLIYKLSHLNAQHSNCFLGKAYWSENLVGHVERMSVCITSTIDTHRYL